MGNKPKVLLIGWDAADWKVINPLMDAGLMPALQSLVDRGVIGNIATLDPPLSPMLWTSIATGKRAYDHGIMGFLEGDESGEKLKPISSSSRKVKAIWEILNQSGYKTQVYGWWPSHPAEPVDGIMVSNFYGKAPGKSWWNDYPFNPSEVHPPEFADKFQSLRVHPSELGYEQLAPFIPEIDKIDHKKDHRYAHLIKDLAECISIHSAATFGLENEDWDFGAVYYNAIDHLSHVFMKYHPPKQEHISEEDFKLYSEVINSTYRFHDMMLARLLELAGPDAHILLMSDHGFYSDHLRLVKLPKEPAAIAREHNPLGVFLLAGPGIKEDERIYGASLLDICPTLLQLFKLPVGSDMEGKVLSQAFVKPEAPRVIDSWEVEGKGQRTQSNREPSGDEKEIMQQLADLGYIEQGVGDNPKDVKLQLDENRFYLSRAYSDGSRYLEAIDILESLCLEYPDNHRYRFSLIRNYLKISAGSLAQEHFELLPRELQDRQENSLLKIEILIHRGMGMKALERLNSLVSAESPNLSSEMNFPVAQSFLRLDRWKQAAQYFKKVLESDPNHFEAKHGLGICYLRLGKLDLALDEILDSIGLLYFNPSAHFHLGECLMKMGEPQEAIQAFEMALRLAPGMSKAQEHLIHIYTEVLPKKERVEALQEEIKSSAKSKRFIVSGLPRSGTSMLMQMLEAAGIQPLTDELREPDLDNPKGYYEHEAIKRLARDQNVIDHAEGKVAKVISQLLTYLPPKYHYKVLLIERPIEEVLKSQEKMLVNLNKLQPDTAVMNLKEQFERSQKKVDRWIELRPNVDVLRVQHGEVLKNPEEAALEILEFLEIQGDVESMARVVDTELYRNRN